MSINGQPSNLSSQGNNVGILSQSCPIKPMKMFKLPVNDPDEFILPASVKEQASFDEGPEDNWGLDNQNLVEGDDLYDDAEEDVAPARSLIRNNWQTNDAEAGPAVDISAEEFGTNGQARAMFLSQSCPTWGTGFFAERPITKYASEAEGADSNPADAEYLDPVDETVEVEAKLSKMSFESIPDMDALGRSPTIFESLRFGPRVSGLEDSEPLESIAETTLEPEPEHSSPTQDDDDELGFQMDE
jgi:hypothetical protein